MLIETAPKQCVERYESFLSNLFKDKLNEFKSVLKQCGALCAGGSVLASIIDDKKYKGDIDIYVNVKDVVLLRDFLISLGKNPHITKRNNSEYSNFFLSINNIKRIVRFKYDNNMSIDLVYIGNSRTVKSVVSNFDFTCCQNWYDSENIYSTDYNSTVNKISEITKDFYPFFLAENKFTLKRMEKYEAKGFRFFIDKKMDSLYKSSLKLLVSKPKLQPKEYLFRELFNIIFTNKHHFSFVKFKKIKKYPKDNFTNIFLNDCLYEDDFKSIEDYEKNGFMETLKTNIELILEYRFTGGVLLSLLANLIEKYIPEYQKPVVQNHTKDVKDMYWSDIYQNYISKKLFKGQNYIVVKYNNIERIYTFQYYLRFLEDNKKNGICTTPENVKILQSDIPNGNIFELQKTDNVIVDSIDTTLEYIYKFRKI